MMQLPPFKLECFFREHEFNVEYNLCGSDCESSSIEDILALSPDGRDAFNNHRLGYTESLGSPSLRQEIAKIYQTIEPEQVLVHTGAEEAIFLFMHAMLRKGDHVIVHWPCYQSLFEVARSIGCEVSLWKAREENDWVLDISELINQIKPNTNVIVINTPHNPTGYSMSLDEYQEVHRIASEKRVVLFSDEVYRESEHRVEDRLPAGCDVGNHAVSLGVMSKTYGLAGLRIGWVATKNKDLLDRMSKLKDYTTICNSAPSEFLAELALRHRKTLTECNMGIIHRNLPILDDFFMRHQDTFTWVRPKAGPIAFPRLIDGDVDFFCTRVMKDKSVLLMPGSIYDDQENHFRIGFGRKDMPEAIGQLDDFLTSWIKE